MRPFRPLTAREEQVAECVGRGLSYRDIAAKLGISPFTVRAHVVAIAAKLPARVAPLSAFPCTRIMLWQHPTRRKPPTSR
jgi:DNA-binding NarL/FixJ family response regulator